jgi:hypothetical protein
MSTPAKVAVAFIAVLLHGCGFRESSASVEIRVETKMESSAPDLDVEREIESVVALRSAAERGDLVAKAQLGPALDAYESALWSRLRSIREGIASQSLLRLGILGDDGGVKVGRARLEDRLTTLMIRLAEAEHAMSVSVLPIEAGLASLRIARRERSLVLAEMAILRRLIAASPP